MRDNEMKALSNMEYKNIRALKSAFECLKENCRCPADYKRKKKTSLRQIGQDNEVAEKSVEDGKMRHQGEKSYQKDKRLLEKKRSKQSQKKLLWK